MGDYCNLIESVSLLRTGVCPIIICAGLKGRQVKEVEELWHFRLKIDKAGN